MRMSYSLGKDLTCRQERIENPYRVCDTDGGNLMPQICIHTLGNNVKKKKTMIKYKRSDQQPAFVK